MGKFIVRAGSEKTFSLFVGKYFQSWPVLRSLIFFVCFGILGASGSDFAFSSNPKIRQLKEETLQLLPPILHREISMLHSDTLSHGEQQALALLLRLADSVPTESPYLWQRAKTFSSGAFQDWGLRLTSHYLYNFREGFFFEEGVTFRDRAYVGLEWDLLGNGLWEAYTKQHLRELEAQKIAIQQNDLDRQDRYGWLYNEVILLFNQAKIRILQQRLDFLNRAFSILGDLYAYRLIRWDDIQKWQKDRDLVATLLRTYQTYNNPSLASFTSTPLGKLNIRRLSPDSLPIVELDAQRLLRAVASEYPVDSLLRLKKKQLAFRYSPLKDIRLRLLVRYTVYDRLFGRGRDFWSVGGALSFPISARWFTYSKAQRTELALERYRLNKEQAHRIREVQNILYEYQYKIADYVKFAYQKRILDERLRREAIKHDLGDPNFQALAVLQDLGDLYEVEFEMLEIQQQLYLLLVRLTRYIRVSDLLTSMKRWTLPETPAFPGARLATYLWSSGFQKDNDFLLWFLKTAGVQDVFLSISSTVNEQKVYRFIERAHEVGLRVYALLGMSITLKTEPERILKKIRTWAVFPFDGVHLDLEPQQQEDWKVQKNAYIDRWLSILDHVAPWARRQGWTLEVSVPWDLDTTTLKSLGRKVDRVWVMVYGKRALSRLRRLVREERQILGRKFGLAFSTEDFRTRPDLDQWLRQVETTLDIHQFALHDVEGLLHLEERTILPARKNRAHR